MSHQLIPYQGFRPQIHPTTYLAGGAIIAGDVKIGANSSVWFNAVLRGDVAPIIIGKRTNIQDAAVVHTSRFQGPTIIGDNVTIGHLALIHACTIESDAFIGMRATIMDKAIIEEQAFIAAGSLVTGSRVVKRRELWAGSPAKFVRGVTDEELEFMRDNIASYVRLAKSYQATN